MYVVFSLFGTLKAGAAGHHTQACQAVPSTIFFPDLYIIYICDPLLTNCSTSFVCYCTKCIGVLHTM